MWPFTKSPKQLANEGSKYHKMKDYAKAAELYREAADMGDPTALNNLGILYYEGNGVKADPIKAYELAAAAASKGIRVALDRMEERGILSVIAECYEYGVGVQRDLKKALGWYMKAAEKNAPKACVRIGHFFFNGDMVEKDRKKAFEWYMRAPDIYIGQYFIASSYYHGDGVEKDRKKAFGWFLRAAPYHPGAMLSIARMYFHGDGVEKDNAKAREWCQKIINGVHGNKWNPDWIRDRRKDAEELLAKLVSEALTDALISSAEEGDAAAQVELGHLLFNGDGMRADPAKAFGWYMKAAVQGHPIGQFYTGSAYAQGDGVGKDQKKAI
ncbi:MAG: sel1 repeat family protein, partial [Methanomassiliicoccaceae archaeon]|nr:sel1 repeat family protein [Methanomassiliicoccaceae archaeon]